MELREYIRILVKSWWFIIPITLIAVTAALVFSYASTPIYRATSTYVAGLAASLSSTTDAGVYGLDTLAGRERILPTYCGVFGSDQVRVQAYSLLAINDPVALGLDEYLVQCNVLPESNILSLITEGPTPALVTRLNEAVGLVGMARTSDLYRAFPLQSLDNVILEPQPVSPNYVQNAILAGVLGLALAITLAFLVEYLRSPLDRLEEIAIRNPVLGVYNERYFQRRFEEEIQRARGRNRPISLAFTELVPDEDFGLLAENIQGMLLRQAALQIQDSLREGDRVAYFGQNVFGLLFAETPGDEARNMLVNLHYEVRLRTFRYEEYTAHFEAKSGLVESSGGALGVQAMMDKAAEALRSAELAGDNAIQFIRTSPAPFFLQGDGAGAGSAEPYGATDLNDPLRMAWRSEEASVLDPERRPEDRG